MLIEFIKKPNFYDDIETRLYGTEYNDKIIYNFIPVKILNEKSKNERVHLLEFEPFNNTFGPKAQRKRPQLATCDINVSFKSTTSV